MAETQLAKSNQSQPGPIAQVKSLLADDAVKKRFSDVLGKKAPQFTASIVNVMSSSTQLKQCNATSVVAAAFVAASLDLPIDSNLGFAAIVPYDKKFKDQNGNWSKMKMAQFQMMYKGFVQLAIRTGEYERMNCSEVYEDELLGYNPITGDCQFVTDFSGCKQRDEGATDKIIGYYAWFRLKSGFVKELYMSKAEVLNHAKKYSQSFRYDLNGNKQTSRWSTDFDAMAKKTVIKMLLSKWGILSVQMQQAITEDQKVFGDNGEEEYEDNQPEVIEAEDPFAIDAPEDEVIDITQ